MKNIFLMITVVAFFCLNACSPAGKNVPTNIETAFVQKFPKATKVKWDMENDKEWEAEFKKDGKEYSANFSITGNWIETEYKISASEISLAVKSTLDKEFNGYKISESEISETADGKVYEFDLQKGDEESKVTIDMNGKLVKKEQKEEETEEDED